jgi:hypothetical protein
VLWGCQELVDDSPQQLSLAGFVSSASEPETFDQLDPIAQGVLLLVSTNFLNSTDFSSQAMFELRNNANKIVADKSQY